MQNSSLCFQPLTTNSTHDYGYRFSRCHSDSDSASPNATNTRISLFLLPLLSSVWSISWVPSPLSTTSSVVRFWISALLLWRWIWWLFWRIWLSLLWLSIWQWSQLWTRLWLCIYRYWLLWRRIQLWTALWIWAILLRPRGWCWIWIWTGALLPPRRCSCPGVWVFQPLLQ